MRRTGSNNSTEANCRLVIDEPPGALAGQYCRRSYPCQCQTLRPFVALVQAYAIPTASPASRQSNEALILITVIGMSTVVEGLNEGRNRMQRAELLASLRLKLLWLPRFAVLLGRAVLPLLPFILFIGIAAVVKSECAFRY